MSTYSIEKVREQMARLSGGNKKAKTETKDRPKLSWWKPELGVQEVRFLPYDNGNGIPFQEVSYYNSKKLSEHRVVAPCQYDLPDSIQTLLTKLRKNRQDDATWKLMKQLQTRESFYVPVVVRGKEDKGVMIWEMSQKVVNQIFSKLTNPDYAEEDLFDLKEGYDFIITAQNSGKQFNGYDVKELTIDVRRKPSPLAKTQKERDDLMATVPNLKEYFKSYVPSEERMEDMINNFLSGDEGTSEGKEVTGEESEDDRVSSATSKIDSAFDDL